MITKKLLFRDCPISAFVTFVFAFVTFVIVVPPSAETMPSVIDRALRALHAIGGVCDAFTDRLVVPPASADGFTVGLRVVHDREFVVTYDGWHHTFDRAEDAYDCFEYGLSESCRLKVTLRGDLAVAWQVEKREYGMWCPGHMDRRRSLAFWRPRRVVYRQNHIFKRAI